MGLVFHSNRQPHWLIQMGSIKGKSAFEHVQNVQILIILHMRKVSSELCSPFIHLVVSNGSVSAQGRP